MTKKIRKIIRKKSGEKYAVHFRNSGVPFFFMELAFHKNGYGAFDYVLLYKDGLLEGYLSEKGLAQAKKFGLQLMKNHEKVHARMTKLKEKGENFIYTDWNAIKQLAKEYGELYRYCEQPMLAGIEEIFEKNCSDPAAYIKNPGKHIINIKGKLAHEILVNFGKMKYDLHLALEKPFIELMNVVGDEPLLFYFTAKEMDQFMNKQKVIPSNKEGIVIANGKLHFNYSDWEKKVRTYDDVLKGRVVSAGKARGIVKIFLDMLKYESIPKGTIVVSGMTNPQMTPYLKNALAIVTDEGGIMCHAAIVARELKIPCIVGTQNATQVLKDGDLIEVDADNGIIRKL
jgi:phosphoenolpyruvate synthase/pyruvate phosphate dikinase